jgi:hypothetical protein
MPDSRIDGLRLRLAGELEAILDAGEPIANGGVEKGL